MADHKLGDRVRVLRGAYQGEVATVVSGPSVMYDGDPGPRVRVEVTLTRAITTTPLVTDVEPAPSSSDAPNRTEDSELVPPGAWIDIVGAVGWDESSECWPQLVAAVEEAARQAIEQYKRSVGSVADSELRDRVAHVPPDGSPFGADAGQPDTCPHGDTNCKSVLGKTVLDKPYHGNCHPWHYHLRSRLNGVYGALAGQGNELAPELRAAIGFLDESVGQPDTEATEQASTCGAVGFWGARNSRYECDKPKGHQEKVHENSSEDPSVIWFGDHSEGPVTPATEQVSERDAALHEALQEDEETLLADTIEQASIPATPTERAPIWQNPETWPKPCPHGILLAMMVCPKCKPEKQAEAEEHARAHAARSQVGWTDPTPATPTGVAVVELDADDPLAQRVEHDSRMDGVDTPGCDCGHSGMGEGWHSSDCTWRQTPATPTEPELLSVFDDPEGVEYDFDEDDQPIRPHVGWDIAFGCRLTISREDHDTHHLTISISDGVQRDGIAVRTLDREQIQDYAYHLIELTEVPEDGGR